ncbi:MULTISPECIES: twin-arginine translocation signal domain-containing protein [Adlercreutzia]|uniref:twin-arginine translocation signal domain-containing protein n=1 Tax=Adlercreutzia TaxID=447020 RepID=UPI001E5FC2ED|nr:MULTISPECIES: twin-arginine translocation signal domain-containing protein [Adlercreutzia]MEE0636273.1 twin-arginine translocation signal domain-containing protein [Adlercreutzia sp.]
METNLSRRGFLTGAAAAGALAAMGLAGCAPTPRGRGRHEDRRHRCCGRDKLARQAGDAHGIRGNR